MKDYLPLTSFGDVTAAAYEEQLRGDEAETVAFLAGLAGAGPALELAIGTGRIALPLAATGIRVDGIDFSQPMVDRLRAKPGGSAIDVVIGDYAAVEVPGSYPLIYLVFNTLFNLLTQDEQVRCFGNAAAHLDPGGAFVVEAFTPYWLYGLRDSQYVDAEAIEVGFATLDLGRHDAVSQTLEESHIRFSAAGVELFPIVTRYSWPAELDLMARIAGLRLASRTAGWQGEPFISDSRRHVSVYVRD